MTIANPYVTTPMRIANAIRDLEDVFTLTFDAPSGFAFRPGQFNMLYVHGVGEVAISISGNADEPERLVHTVRSVGTVTRAMATLEVGDMLGVRGPYGSSWPLEEMRGRDVLVIAGGLGLAPLRSAIRHVLARRNDFGRVTLLVGARSPEQLLYREDLEKWRGRFDCRVKLTVDRAGRDWLGNVGVVTTLLASVPLSADTAVLVCGPEPMMRFVVLELRRRGVASSSIWLSMERNMKCGVGLCGHCQFGPLFVCKDGPVHRLDRVSSFLFVREV
ncbi:Oxidoreductase FAD/NAD(P)-binding [Labilithrix luteola]|uniref:Oxidoreductase FAD/NAD(P)-binding n=1 Tax=Labilithrix luteola TaxID=1391654 RepID=A0A0K1PRV6_9BACT|nr:FAD/NAD(P)-binding protein [Labilithrix luteola]AKU96258.1 Oxidoreductase FAD/NAD(P)-binding [Labilithrix luteola]